MATVSMRDLARRAGEVVDEVARSGRPALVTRHGRPVAALIRVRGEDLEDFILANAPEFVQSMREADEEAARGDTIPWEQVRAELHQLAESLPEAAAEELAAVGHLLSQKAQPGDVEEVSDPEEIAIVQAALRDPGTADEFTPEQVLAELAARRQRRRA